MTDDSVRSSTDLKATARRKDTAARRAAAIAGREDELTEGLLRRNVAATTQVAYRAKADSLSAKGASTIRADSLSGDASTVRASTVRANSLSWDAH